MGQGKVGNRRLAEQEIPPWRCNCCSMRPAIAGHWCRAWSSCSRVCGAAAEQLAAVGHQHLGASLAAPWRNLHRQGFRLEHQGHGMGNTTESAQAAKPWVITSWPWEQRRRGFFLLQATGDQGGVAVDIGADSAAPGFCDSPR